MNAVLTVLSANLSLSGTNDIVRHMLSLETFREKMLHALFYDRSRVVSKTSIAAACVALDSVDSVDTLFKNTSNWIDGMIKKIVLGQRALVRLLITFIAKSRTDDWIDPSYVALRIFLFISIIEQYEQLIHR